MKARNLFTLLLVFTFSGTAFGATITWIGGNGNWDIASNWDLGYVPTYDDEVIINSGEVRLESIGEADRIRLRGSLLIVEGTLMLRPEIIIIDEVVDVLDIDMESTLINEGYIIFTSGGSNHIHLNDYFMNNDGIFRNEVSGYVYMNGNGSYRGMRSGAYAEFTNLGAIHMEDVSIGIRSYGDLYNYGAIDINSSRASLHVRDLFYIGSAGIINANNYVYLEGNIDNYGVLNLETDLTSTYAFYINGRLDVQLSGRVSIKGAYTTGIQINHSYSKVYNSGNIEIDLDQTSSIEILNGGIFANNYSGNINCTSYNAQAANSDGLCNNYGTWHLKNENEGPNGAVKIEGSITNESSGKLYIEGKLTLPTGSGITNEGHMFVTSNISQSQIQGRIINSGMLNDVYGKLLNVDNRSIIARPVFYSSRIKNALALGSQPDVTVLGWYTTETGTNSAGSYNSSTNTFKPTKHVTKLNSLFVEVMLNSNNSIHRHEVKNKKSINSNDIPWSADNDFELNDYNIVTFPNPVVDALNIESRSTIIGDSFDARLVNIDGKTIARKNCRDNCQIRIPRDLVNGIYFLSIEKDGVAIQAPEQIRVIH